MHIRAASSGRRVLITVLAAVGLAAALAPAAASARPAGADTDGRPNILVVMTDDMASTDLKVHAQRAGGSSSRRERSSPPAVDSFPLCCPAPGHLHHRPVRAHNGVAEATSTPYGWYGMQDRRNILPAWLEKAGTTGLIGKWLNGYGARDAHGEVPNGSTSGAACSTSRPTTTRTSS